MNKEHEDVLKSLNERDPSHVIKIVKLCKTFQTGRVGSRKDHRALDFVSFSCRKGTVLGVLGHNGSGKTTTINLLTGVHAPSFGDAFIGPYSIQENIQAIRRVIGVCPQKDILWDSMTAREHIKLFCLLKGIPRAKHEEVTLQVLKNVRLETRVDKLVGTFSGGMKRRLSVAIASIGDPIAIFLDEPTAGLDPANRRELWKVIERLKQDRAIVLTTHSMEEADTISDKIVIYAVGRLRAVGDSLHLKKRFGAGYHLSLTTDEPRAEELKAHVSGFIPEAHLDAENSGLLSYSLPRVRVQQLSKFFKWLEEVSAKRLPTGELAPGGSDALVKDFGLSQTTLEEVFIRLTHGDAILRQMMLGNGAAAGDFVPEESDRPGTALKQMQLNVALDGAGEAIGFVTVDVETDLATCRRVIDAQLSKAPASYSFMSQGIEVDRSQENSMYAVDFLPMIVIKSHGDGKSMPASPNASKQNKKKDKQKLIELSSSSDSNEQVLSLKKEVKKLQTLLASTQSALEASRAQWQARERELLAKIATLELQQSATQSRGLERGLSELQLPSTFEYSIPPPPAQGSEQSNPSSARNDESSDDTSALPTGDDISESYERSE